MPAAGPRREISMSFPMKRPGLTPLLLAATLFIAPALPGADTPAPAPAMSSRAADLRQRFDKNRDGKLDEHELADAREVMLQDQMQKQAARAVTPQLQAKMLERFDKNHDGRLDDEERSEMRRYAEENGLGPDGEVRRELLQRFDQNADGKLDDPERAALQKFLRERRAENGEARTTAPGAKIEQARLDAVAAEVAKRKAERAKRAQEAATPKP